MTVEIAFALVTAAVLAGVIFAVAWALALVLGLSGSAGRGVLVGGALLGAVAGVGRLVRVLLRFDKQRRMGN
ncbi:hypothetical protein G3I37_13860 [Streptomyces anulatus]|uniref:Uncharacterized protein n=2 Tax=Streptomyces anulatus TaxID=1892 RepID=A0A7K3RG37_STRAQ|nr:hypothetical protein [Streptomyces anulatus]NED25965.1 hypothetical protein [Streptomyces anulatus]